MPLALVTGANRGIGLELCRQLIQRGFEVIGTSRKTSPELEKLNVRVEPLEISEQKSIEALVRRLSNAPPIDLLINNAGILHRDGLSPLDPDLIRQQFEVNALGPVQLSAALLPLLAPGAKIAMITSRMGSMGDNTSGGYYGYRMSKAALNAGAVSLAHDIRDRGISLVILHPGFVRTRMTGGRGDVGPDISASRLLDRIEELSLQNSGVFVHANGEELPW